MDEQTQVTVTMSAAQAAEAAEALAVRRDALQTTLRAMVQAVNDLRSADVQSKVVDNLAAEARAVGNQVDRLWAARRRLLAAVDGPYGDADID